MISASLSPASAALSLVTKAPCLVAVEQLGAEGVREAGELFVELLELDLVGFAEIGSGVDELVVVVLDQALSFGIELQRIELLVDGGDTLKELGVEEDGVTMCGELGRLDGAHLLQRGIGVGSGEREERRRSRDCSSSPLFSMATMVLSNVGGAGLLAMA